MARSSKTVLTPTASTGATATPAAPMVTIPEDRLPDVSTMREVCEAAGLSMPAIADQLSAFIMHERNGVHLYRSVAARSELDELCATYEEFGDQTLRHVEIYANLIGALGGDPQYVSAAARAVEHMNAAVLQSTFLMTGSCDPMTRELAMLDAVALAEAKCHANWQFLAKLAVSLPEGTVRDVLEEAVDDVQAEEETHLDWAESMREQLVAELVLPGVELADDEVGYVEDDDG